MPHPVFAVIPARLASTRFPRKLLADRTGKPLLAHVLDRARQARRLSRILIAADHEDIRRAMLPHLGDSSAQVVMTRGDHPNGTSRIAEVVALLESTLPAGELPDIIVNVQGDEPEIDPTVIDLLVAGLEADASAPMATLASPFSPEEDPANPNIVKVVLDQRSRAMYFSRSLIPYDRDKRGVRPLKHIGLYAYRRAFLPAYVALPPTPLEQMEQLEQLRALEHGHPIAVMQTIARHHGIDTPEQYEAFVRRWQTRA